VFRGLAQRHGFGHPANPAWLWLEGGEQRFARDCMRCHRT
jgi:hypothetical protein